MDQDLSGSDLQSGQDADNNQSLVGKLKKNVSEIINNTPLSKWFGKSSPNSSVRRRQDDSDDEEELEKLQPPTKRTKLPLIKETLSLDVSAALSPISSTAATSKVKYRRFPEPVAGPSGFGQRKSNVISSTLIVPDRSHPIQRPGTGLFAAGRGATKTAHKEPNSDSEESTSGYSSGRVGSKELVSQEGSKQASPAVSPKKTRSLFENSNTSRLLAAEAKNASLSSRMPAFNPSMFGSSSFADRTLASQRLLSSPFYNGRTIYGGASAYGRQTKRCPEEIQKILRQSVRIQPTNSEVKGRNTQLSKTARRILDTLEKYSSPVSDAKKIPVAAKRGNLTSFIGANPYRVREPRGASSRELQVPSVTDLLKSKMELQKSRLQSTTESVRQIATKPESSEAYQIPTQTPDNLKHISKMKTKITSISRQKVHVDETVPQVNLKPVSFPIDKLPTFDFIVPPPAKPAVQPEKPPHKPAETLQENGKIGAFKFSSPIVLADCRSALKTINHFKFSEPLVKKRRSIHAELDDQPKKNNGENAPEALKGSNLWDKFKPKNNTWECSVCMIRNQPEALKCVACETPNAQKKPCTGNGTEAVKPFAPIAKEADQTWECPTCMIRNKSDILQCLACSEKKPDKSHAAAPPAALSSLLQSSAKTVPISQPLGGSLAFPKMPLSSPAAKVDQSAAEGFAADFKKKPDEWECQVCMVRNKADSSKCQCCESANPSVPAPAAASNSTAALSTFNFGIDKNTATSFSFGIPPEAAKATAPQTNAAQIFGEKRETPKEAQRFSFGVPAKETEPSKPTETPKAPEGTKAAPTFTFGAKPADDASTKTPAFSFGAAKKTEAAPTKEQAASEEAKPAVKPAPEATVPSFSFGLTGKTEPKAADKAQETTRVNPLLKPSEKLPEKSAIAPAGFSFGLPKALSTPVSSALTVPNKRTQPEKAEATPPAKSALFSFQCPTTNGDAIKPMFGKPAEDKPAAPGGFSFNFASSTPAATSAVVAPTFTSPTTQTDSAKQAAPLFKFGASTSETPKPASNGFSFGSKPAETKPFTFGPSSTPSFTAAPTKPAASQFSFGSNTETKPGTFSAGSTENKPALPFASSGFGAPTSKPAFSFGASTPAPTFSFGSNQKPESTFTALAAAPANMFGQSFGATQAPPTFGAASAQNNGSFNFGAAPAAGSQKAGFSFGASSANSDSAAPSAGFNFGSSALGGPAPAGGFNFTSAAPAFDANAKPAFNFTGGAGLAAFSATPSQEGAAMPPRKMKRAVRRTVR